MRIARVVTICAALISAMIGAETERSRRPSQPQNHLSPPRIENISTTPITFTTLRPEVRSFSSQIDASVLSVPNRRHRVRSSGFSTVKLRDTNRRRRQLHRNGKKTRLGRSFDVNEKTIETVHGPKVQGEIHIEPIYRVSKNKNVLDSIIDTIRRLIGTEKTLGPLVGPFHFPGVGDKVYVRLLEPVLPDHLVIRFVSHSPVTKVESPIGKDISLPIQIAKHPEVSAAVSHEHFVVSPNELVNSFDKHSAVASIGSDSLLSPSNQIQASKPTGLTHEFLGGSFADAHIPRTYGVAARSNFTNAYQPLSSTNHAVNWNFAESIKDHKSNSYSINQVHQPDKDPRPKYDVRDFHPFNASDFQEENPFVPVRNHDQLRFENQFTGSSESPPKYSLAFVSKKMKYLNLDGSVSDEIDDEGFKPMEAGPASSKGVRVIRKIHVRRKQILDTSTNDEKDYKRAGKGSDAFSEVHRKMDDVSNVFRNDTISKEDDRKEHFPNFGQRLNNETRSIESTGETIKSVLTKQQSRSTKNSTESRT